MRLAILSDIHGNLEAFRRVLEDMEAQGITEALCLGDLIGYGPQPEEVTTLVREQGFEAVMGNHEWGLADASHLSWFNRFSRRALKRTGGLLSHRSLKYVTSLPSHLVRHGARFVHGMPPDSVNTYLFQVKTPDLPPYFEQVPERIVFVGHTHELVHVVYDGQRVEREVIGCGPLSLEPGLSHILNCGSVGQPRDGDNRAKYVVWEPQAHRAEVRCVEYDIQRTVDLVHERGLPDQYGDRLW